MTDRAPVACPLLASLLLSLAAIGCGDHAGPAPETLPVADVPSNGRLRIDEAALHAELQDSQLAIEVPVKALRDGDGELVIALLGVDGKQLDTARVTYDLAEGETETLTALLPSPKNLGSQEDRVRYNVRVTGDDALQVTKSLMYTLSPYELRLEGPSGVKTEKVASYRARMSHPLTHAPLANAEVTLTLSQDGDEVHTLSAQTDATGSAVFEIDVQKAGAYELSASTSHESAPLELVETVTAQAPGQKLLITTDKPIYQPGQTIHLRALALENPNNTPLAKTAVTFELEDGKGNKVLHKSKQTDAYGIASLDFKLASLVNLGTFKVRALASDNVGEKTVEVSHYALPKFEVKLQTAEPWYAPAAKVTGTVDARYFFGKDLAGADVVIEALTLDVGENVFERVMGKTDAQGHLGFSVTLPASLVGLPIADGNAVVTLRATVTDSAGQEVRKEFALTVAEQAVRLTAVPEATQLVPGIENRVHVFATDPLGAPLAETTVSVNGLPDLTTDAFGHAVLRFVPTNASTALVLTATTSDGKTATASFNFEPQQGVEHVLVRTDKSVYAVGETVNVQVLTDRNESRVYVDWLNDGQAIDMRTLQARDGVASFAAALDASMLGENRIEAYVVDTEGNLTRAGRTVLVNHESALHVELTADAAKYAPGEPAKLTFSVTDQAGEPAVAALGVQIVDEAVFGLIDARPGLLRTYFELEEAFAKPTYELHAPAASFEQLIFEGCLSTDQAQASAAQTQTEAQLAALVGNRMMGLSAGSWPATLAAANAALDPSYTREKKRLIELLTPAVSRGVTALSALGCLPNGSYCEPLQQDYGDALRALVGTAPAVDLWGETYVSTSAWGSAQRFATAGPDEQRGTGDDHEISLAWSDFGADVWEGAGFADAGVSIDDCAGCGNGAFPEAAGWGNQNAAGTGGVGAVTDHDNGAPTDPSASAEPRVRREFPETLYVNPSLITDSSGKATISLDMADSITSWRVSALANSQRGDLGGGRGAITVFQDFFVDVSFPAELTRGDQVEFPIVVYNYLKVAQSVQLDLEAAAWFTALGSTTATVELAAGEVRAVRIPVRVDRVGTQTLTVRAYGTKVSDAVARTVRVVPDGLAVPLAQSGSLADGTTTLSASFPLGAVPGSEQLYLDVFPAFLAQAVQGLDNILAEPNGCFEQTTSTTWPNVLVARYMEQTDQVTTEIQLKAEALISAGYQRLLTFEHSGGGFSWFGESDGAPDLSVTAFGLMEFADMAKVQAVDPTMLERTQAWLLGQQQADGSWQGGQSEFFSFHASSSRNTAFTLWALAQYGYSGAELQRALDYVSSQVKQTDDAYTLALAANAFALAAPTDAFLGDLLEWLEASKHVADGKTSWDTGGTQTNFYGAGNDSTVSTTALVTHALISAGGHGATVKSALDYLTAAKDPNGNFGSTQATVWALKTLLLAALEGTDGAVGTLDVSLDGSPFSSIDLTPDQADVMTRVDLSSLASTGTHQVTLAFAGTGKVSYNLVSSHHLPWASVPAPPTGPLSVGIAYDRTTLALDETVNATVTVKNLLAATQNMILVTVGIPPGFALQSEDLEAYVTAGTLSRYEQTGKQLILYMTTLAPGATQSYGYRLRATMPVVAADGGAEAHPYYEPDQTTQSASTLLVATAN